MVQFTPGLAPETLAPLNVAPAAGPAWERGGAGGRAEEVDTQDRRGDGAPAEGLLEAHGPPFPGRCACHVP